jgi:hypothetical protein
MKRFIEHLPKTLDGYIKLIFITALFGWNLVEGAVYENVYPLAMIHVYPIALWRIMLLVLVVLASDWSAHVTLLLVYMIFFYIMDLEVTIEKWSLTDLQKK